MRGKYLAAEMRDFVRTIAAWYGENGATALSPGALIFGDDQTVAERARSLAARIDEAK